MGPHLRFDGDCSSLLEGAIVKSGEGGGSGDRSSSMGELPDWSSRGRAEQLEALPACGW